MSTNSDSPDHPRPRKRSRSGIELDFTHKRMRYTPPLLTPSTQEEEDSQFPVSAGECTRIRPIRIPRSASAPPVFNRKRHNTGPQVRGTVEAWVWDVGNSISRPCSAPPDASEIKPETSSIQAQRLSFEAIRKMSSKRSYSTTRSGASESHTERTQNSGRPVTSSFQYRRILEENAITMDIAGLEIPENLRTFVNEYILKQHDTGSLTDEEVSEVIQAAAQASRTVEGSEILSTPMFPIKHPGTVRTTGGALWNTIALPRESVASFGLASPKPDVYLGYSDQPSVGFPRELFHTLVHPMARPYTQPAGDILLPFLVFELKSERSGGTLYAAENQAAGSGSHSVNSVSWLLQEAQQSGFSDFDFLLDTITFSLCVTHRTAALSVHWRAADEKLHYMSHVNTFSMFIPEQIRKCNDAVRNIMEWAVGHRKTMIVKALKALSPVPTRWNPPPFEETSTPATSLEDSPRPSKK